jgi:transcriptional regulator of acetoin/glycerol metabolism
VALSAQARSIIARTRAALALPPVVYVPAELPELPPSSPPPRTLTIAEVVDAHIAHVLAECDGNISEAARRLGIYRSSLQRRIRVRQGASS